MSPLLHKPLVAEFFHLGIGQEKHGDPHHDGNRGSISEVEVFERLNVHQAGQRLGLVHRSALGDEINLREKVEGAVDQVDDHECRNRAQHRNGNVPKLLHSGCAVDCRRLVEIFGNALQSGQINDDTPADRLPDMKQPDDDHSRPIVRQEINRFIENAELLVKDIVDQAVLAACKKELEQKRDDDPRRDDREIINRPERDFVLDELQIDQYGEHDGQKPVDRNGHPNVQHRIADRHPDLGVRIGKRRFVIVETDERILGIRHDAVILEADDNVSDHRVDDEYRRTRDA